MEEPILIRTPTLLPNDLDIDFDIDIDFERQQINLFSINQQVSSVQSTNNNNSYLRQSQVEFINRENCGYGICCLIFLGIISLIFYEYTLNNNQPL